MTASGEAPPLAGAPGLPVPESLLVPLLDAAAQTVARLDAATLPSVLRPLGGFDRRGLQSSTARQQLRRALEVDAPFREQVVEAFAEQAEVRAALETWDAEDALACVEDAAERDDLAWLASALCAARPTGWAFGLGMVCAVAARDRSEKEHDDDVRAHETQLASLDEARRRAEEARHAAQADTARLEEELKEERRARRERERRSEEEVDAALCRRDEAEAAAEQARGAAAAAEARLVREAERARAAEAELRSLRRRLAERPEPAAPPLEPAAGPVDVIRGVTAEPEPPAPSPAAARRAPSRRVTAPCPPGLRADAPDALDAMLRIRGVVLVADGYNVSMAGWGDAAPTDQRARLVAALERLHLRLRCDVVVVFDGADVAGVPAARRSGVRVRFSTDGEKADPVVVREVTEQPLQVPVIVASSDRWVREHAESAGATVVPAAALLEVLRR